MKTISFKVSEQEARSIRERARRQRVTVSEFLRRRAAMPLSPVDKPKLVSCPLTGAMIYETTENLPPLTVASTREMLADFP